MTTTFWSACFERGGCARTGPDRGASDWRANSDSTDGADRHDAEFQSLHAGARHKFAGRARTEYRQPVSAGVAADADTELSAWRDVCCPSGHDTHTRASAGTVAAAALRAQRDEGLPQLEETMKLRTFALSSASALMFALAATIASADPAAGNPYTQNTTPEERAQSQQLNSQAATDAQQSTAAVQAQTDADQAQYQQQMDRYQDNQARYQAQKDRYLDERAEYNYDRSHPHAWWHERYERATLNHFYDIPARN